MDHRGPICAVLASLTLTLTPSEAASQVPDGWCVSADINVPAFSGPGGLFLHHPRTPGMPTAIAGVPLRLTRASGGFGGANSVELIGDDVLIVGELAPNGSPVGLFRLQLNGQTVGTMQSIDVGVALSPTQGAGQIAQTAVLSNGNVLVCVSDIASGPLAGQILGIVSGTMQTVAPVPVAPIPAGIANAMAIDDAGLVYVAMVSPTQPYSSTIYTVPVGGGTPMPFTNLPGAVFCMHVRGNDLFVATGLAPGSFILRINRTNGNVLASTPTDAPNTFAIEDVTGYFIVGTGTVGVPPNALGWTPPHGLMKYLHTGGNWGVPAGLAINPDPETYGAPTPVGGPDYRWQLRPNPGGLPLLGKPHFQLQVAAANGTTASGAWFMSAMPGLFPILGVDLLLGAPIVLSGPVSASGTIALPIPKSPSLQGATLFLQTVHLNMLGLSASDGLEMTIL